MALIFVLRIVLLWALLVVSPVLFLLAIFGATRRYFYSWLGLYARWLLIGPLMALGIVIVVSIWKAVGLPITSSYTGFGEFGSLSNIGFFLPGKELINNLNNTQQMMEYLLFLIMLYLPIVFAFMLTRQKGFASAATIVEKREGLVAPAQPPSGAGPATEEATVTKTPVEGIKGFLTSKLAGFKETALPAGVKAKAPATVETATSYLPEHLALTKVGDMMGLISNKGSRNAHKQAVEKLAAPDKITDANERKKVTAIRSEIESRASQGDASAAHIMNEIKNIEQTTVAEGGGGTTVAGGPPIIGGTGEPVEVKVEVEPSESESQKAAPITTKKIDTEEVEGLDQGETTAPTEGGETTAPTEEEEGDEETEGDESDKIENESDDTTDQTKDNND